MIERLRPDCRFSFPRAVHQAAIIVLTHEALSHPSSLRLVAEPGDGEARGIASLNYSSAFQVPNPISLCQPFVPVCPFFPPPL
jgi:hypothetical protein